MHPYTSFVALGDSFTEGLDDPGPDGMYRGWADLVATRLAAEAPGFPYANLAVRGRLLAAVVDEQVPPALEMGADLVSFAAGANDAMRRHFDAGAIAAGLDDVVARIRATGATLVMFTTAADLAERLPAGWVLRRRLESLTPREREVMALVVTGMLNKQIAWQLGTVEKTIKVHRSRVMEKMAVDSIAELVRLAEKVGIPAQKQPTAASAHR